MTKQVSMAVGGESPSREAINLTTGRNTRYNPRDVRAMNITKDRKLEPAGTEFTRKR